MDGRMDTQLTYAAHRTHLEAAEELRLLWVVCHSEAVSLVPTELTLVADELAAVRELDTSTLALVLLEHPMVLLAAALVEVQPPTVPQSVLKSTDVLHGLGARPIQRPVAMI